MLSFSGIKSQKQYEACMALVLGEGRLGRCSCGGNLSDVGGTKVY